MANYTFDTFFQYYDEYYTNVIDEEIASDVSLIEEYEADLYERYSNYEARIRAQAEEAAARAEAEADAQESSNDQESVDWAEDEADEEEDWDMDIGGGDGPGLRRL